MKISKYDSSLAAMLFSLGCLAGCDVDQTRRAELPSVDVDIDGEPGQLPEYDIETPDVDLKTKETEVTVPDVDVEMEEKKLEVPDVDIEIPKE